MADRDDSAKRKRSWTEGEPARRSDVYLLERHGNDPEEAIVRAVNDTRDNDTVAAIVGAAVGALHGLDRLPPRWRDGLLGRTREDDDGRVWAIIEGARRRWGEPSAPDPG